MALKMGNWSCTDPIDKAITLLLITGRGPPCRIGKNIPPISATATMFICLSVFCLSFGEFGQIGPCLCGFVKE